MVAAVVVVVVVDDVEEEEVAFSNTVAGAVLSVFDFVTVEDDVELLSLEVVTVSDFNLSSLCFAKTASVCPVGVKSSAFRAKNKNNKFSHNYFFNVRMNINQYYVNKCITYKRYLLSLRLFSLL